MAKNDSGKRKKSSSAVPTMGKNDSGKRKKKAGKTGSNTTTPSSKRRRKAKTPSPTKPPDAAPDSVGADVKFMTNKQLEKYSQQANESQKQQKPTDLEVRERQARDFIEEHSNTMKLDIRNCMFPWVSDVSLSNDGKIICYRNQINHNSISSKLANEITNNFLGNPIGADLSGKVHEKAMGIDMSCLLTYNTTVSSNAMAKCLHIEGRRIRPPDFYNL